MCIYKRCALCGKTKLGLLMSWRDADSSTKHVGHVCYTCEDRECTLMTMGRASIAWLESINGCE